MMRPRHLVLAATLIGLGACAAFRPEPPVEQDAEQRLDRGLAALDAGRYREAFDDLAWVYANCPDHARGAEALVGLAALELDPRNTEARPGVASDLLGRIIREPAPVGYVRPFAESAYLMALALGAPAASEEDREADQGPIDASADAATLPVRASQVLQPAAAEPAYGCGPRIVARGWVPPAVPTRQGPSLVTLLSQAENARTASVAAADTLRRELETVRRRLQETEAELERIRKTLKP